MRFILRYMRPYLLPFLVAVTCVALETAAEIIQPTFMSYVVDKGVLLADVPTILHYGAIMLAIALAGAAAAVARNYFSTYAAQHAGRDLRSSLYSHIQTLSQENIDQFHTASLVTRLTNDVNVATRFINSLGRISFKMPLTVIGALALLIYQMPAMAPVVVVVILLTVVIIVLMTVLSRPRYARLQKSLDRLNGVAQEYLQSVRVVKAFAAEKREDARFTEASENYAMSGIEAMHISATFIPLINLTANAGILALLYFSQAQDPGQIGHLMAAVNYMTQLIMSLGLFGNVLSEGMRALTSSERIAEVLTQSPAQQTAANPVSLKDTSTQQTAAGLSLTFKDVGFTYAGSSEPALSHVSFNIEAGTTLGIIGPTGSGKTTLINLVPRFYDATYGTVLLNGCDVTQLDPHELRASIAVVNQSALLFSGTIEDNLRWGDEDATLAELTEACGIACATSFIEQLPEGYKALLGQGGVNLSGGQKQRLCLARALLKDPGLLILDDCTSALDSATEHKVLEGLRQLAHRQTTLLISQRIATMRYADAILVLENGQVRGFGTHDSLLKDCATYRAIYASQMGREEPGHEC
ncbi:MAG: ABC transporter ATP-binding protein [Coriobacteriales bacterium]|nr:ABC transporter ATP-binding protein [Coriobacteriales bacterium]